MASSQPTPVLIEAPGPHSHRQLDGTGLTIALISTRWYAHGIVDPLVAACKAELLHKGVASDSIMELQVPGAYELPFAAGRAIASQQHRLDAVICIGCMVKGATLAYEFVSEAATMGLMKLNVKSDTPVVNGLLTCQSEAAAKHCAATLGACVAGSQTGSQRCNHGVAWAQQAIELALLKRATARLMEAKCQCLCHCGDANCQCACHCRQCKCKTCTCGGECRCASCFGHHGEKGELEELVASFDKAMKGEMDKAVSSVRGYESKSKSSQQAAGSVQLP